MSETVKYTLTLTNTETNRQITIGGDTLEELTTREHMLLHQSGVDGLFNAMRDSDRDMAALPKTEPKK